MADYHHEIAHSSIPRRMTWALWATLALPPLAFLTALTVRYALAPVACHTGWGIYAVHLSAGVAVGVCVGAGFLARRELRAGDERPQTQADRYLGLLAIAFSVFFTFTTVAQWIPSFILDPCQR